MEKNKLLEISEIKDLHSIAIRRLTDTKEDKDPVVIIVFCNETKSLVYSELDKEFPYFFSTVKRVYNEEKNKNHIYIDDLTKEFLESNTPNVEITALKKEIGNIGSKERKINYKIKKVELEFNLLKYIIEKLFPYFNRNIIVKDLKGMSKFYKLTTIEEGINSSLPFTYIENGEFSHTYIFPGIFGGNELYIDITYNEKITINAHDEDNKILFTFEVITTSEYGKFIECIYERGILTSKKINELETTEEKDEIYSFMNIKGKTYILPWNDKRIINTCITEGQLKTELTEYIDYTKSKDNTHIQIRNKKTVINTSEGYWKTDEYGIYKLEGNLVLQTDDQVAITNLYYLDGEENYVLKETIFLPSDLNTGIYKSELSGKAFYKVYKINEKNTLIEVENELDEFVKGYQILNENELRLIIRKGDK